MNQLKKVLSIIIALFALVACGGSDDDMKDAVEQSNENSETATKADVTALLKLVKYSAEKSVKGVEITSNAYIEVRVTSSLSSTANGVLVQELETGKVFKIAANNKVSEQLLVGQKIKINLIKKFLGIHQGQYVIGKSASENGAVTPFSDTEFFKAVELAKDDVKPVTPVSVSISDLFTQLDAYKLKKGIVVKIKDIQFDAADSDKTYYWGNQDYAVTYLIDKSGNRIAISTSKTATFGSKKVKGDFSGTVTALLSFKDGAPQLVLRSEKDLDFTLDRFSNNE